MEGKERLSSIFFIVFRVLLLLTIIFNSLVIIVINFILSPEKAKTYDLFQSYALITMSAFVFIISVKIASMVVYDRSEKKVIAHTLFKKIIINKSEILRIERVFPSKCRIVYKKNNSEKSILFIPKLFGFSLLNYAKSIERLISR